MCQWQIIECILLLNLGVQEMKTSDLNTIVTDSVENCDKKSKRTTIQCKNIKPTICCISVTVFKVAISN